MFNDGIQRALLIYNLARKRCQFKLTTTEDLLYQNLLQYGQKAFEANIKLAQQYLSGESKEDLVIDEDDQEENETQASLNSIIMNTLNQYMCLSAEHALTEEEQLFYEKGLQMFTLHLKIELMDMENSGESTESDSTGDSNGDSNP